MSWAFEVLRRRWVSQLPRVIADGHDLTKPAIECDADEAQEVLRQYLRVELVLYDGLWSVTDIDQRDYLRAVLCTMAELYT